MTNPRRSIVAASKSERQDYLDPMGVSNHSSGTGDRESDILEPHERRHFSPVRPRIGFAFPE